MLYISETPLQYEDIDPGFQPISSEISSDINTVTNYTFDRDHQESFDKNSESLPVWPDGYLKANQF